jgi:hypothetical protein
LVSCKKKNLTTLFRTFFSDKKHVRFEQFFSSNFFLILLQTQFSQQERARSQQSKKPMTGGRLERFFKVEEKILLFKTH